MQKQARQHCPICKTNGLQALNVGKYPIADCQKCTHRYLDMVLPPNHVDQQYGDDYFEGGGAGYVDYLAQESLISSYGKRYTKILRPHCDPGTVLDIGSAAGFLMKGFQEAGWRPTGLEPNAKMALAAKTRFGLETKVGSLEDVRLQQTFDLITMVQVIAHFREVQLAMANASRMLNPNGLMLIETWDCQSIPARVLGKRWHEYSPPSVVNWFTPNSLQKLAAQHCLDPIRKGRPKKYVTGRHALSLISHSLTKSGGHNANRSRFSFVPEWFVLPYPSFDVFWVLLRKRAS